MPRTRSAHRTLRFVLLLLAFLVGGAGLYQLVAAEGIARRTSTSAIPMAHRAETLKPSVVARMDSPAFSYSSGWSVSAEGADPAEPANPELEPSGVISFTYSGSELALHLAVGSYWGFLYVTVDGEPANLLPSSRGHAPPAPRNAGYKPLYAPDLAQDDGTPHLQWVRVHHTPGMSGPHTARIEVWRSWGQTPVRAVAVDALPAETYRLWPGVLLLLLGLWLTAPVWPQIAHISSRTLRAFSMPRVARRLLEGRGRPATVLALTGLLCIAAGTWGAVWSVCTLGLILLGIAGVLRPALWYATLFFGLPFYYAVALPLLPGRSVNLVDTGVYLGMAVTLAHAILVIWSEARTGAPRGAGPSLGGGTRARRAPVRLRFAPAALLLLALLASWSLVSVQASERYAVALREWRTVFLMALVLAAGLTLALRVSRSVRQDIVLLCGGWLAGATVMAAAGLLLYPSPEVTIPAEGVTRLRGFYGSPNNLALYLGRTLAVTLGLALFLRGSWLRALLAVAALVQGTAFLLTFSRGGLLLALPAMMMTLWVGGYWLLRHEGRPARLLWVLALLSALVMVALLPVAGTERFQQAVSLGAGTGFLRLNLWRSAWQMALDHPLLGVGPDNFLYAYRSGYIFPQAWMEPDLNHPHTWLLDWWVRIGVPGMIFGLLYWGMVVLGAVRGLRVRAWSALSVGVLAATLAALAHGLIDVSYALPDLMAVWALFGVLASIELPAAAPVPTSESQRFSPQG